jgi:hypothetical protein
MKENLVTRLLRRLGQLVLRRPKPRNVSSSEASFDDECRFFGNGPAAR